MHRLKRVRVSCLDLFGNDGVRVVPQRTSNGYWFNDPSPAGRPNTPESDFKSGTVNQEFISSFEAAFGGERTGRSGRKGLSEEGAGAIVGT